MEGDTMSQKTIIACCASSMITSKIVAEKILNLAKDHKIEAPKIIQCKFDEVHDKLQGEKVDCIIPTSPFPLEIDCSIKVILGTPLITGTDEIQTLDDVLVMLKS